MTARSMLEKDGVEKITIPSNFNRKVLIGHDSTSYVNRDLMENCFGGLVWCWRSPNFVNLCLISEFISLSMFRIDDSEIC